MHRFIQQNSFKAKFLLETLNILLVNLCIRHGLHQHSPCGGLATFASTPSGQPFLHCFFFILGTNACCYCGCVKFHSFKDCPRFACSFSAHMYSEEFGVAWTTCRESKTFTPTSLTYGEDAPTHQSLLVTAHQTAALVQVLSLHSDGEQRRGVLY